MARGPKPNVPADFLPVARGFTAAEVEGARALVCRSARDRGDCLDLQDALGLLRSALECCGLQERGPFAEARDERPGGVDGEECGNV